MGHFIKLFWHVTIPRAAEPVPVFLSDTSFIKFLFHWTRAHTVTVKILRTNWFSLFNTFHSQLRLFFWIKESKAIKLWSFSRIIQQNRSGQVSGPGHVQVRDIFLLDTWWRSNIIIRFLLCFPLWNEFEMKLTLFEELFRWLDQASVWNDKWHV